ncbi:hypothetical protein L9F63_005981 [Diploptera punctata]|uniref:Protein takeout n=1 Tax=Diploptera punctata TaxID=6984 RepID=A0AAD8E4Z3_DIPPU|nr:hypothetical protein L9F63_005981 [Diploptera punctata]
MWPPTRTVLVATALFCALLDHAAGLKASDLFKVCNRNDPHLDDCARQTLEELRPKFKKGIPELKMASVDPMVIPRVSVTQGSGPVSIDSTFTNLHVEGITNYKINKMHVDPDNHRIDIEVELPYMYVYGDYTINGKVLVLPIQGNGDSWSNYTDVTGTAALIGHKETRKGEDFWKLDKLNFSLAVKRAIIHMNNLFNGNKQLGDSMNKFMSDNWEVVFEELKPVVDEAISAILYDVAIKVFDRFPMNQLFPEK